MSLSLLFFGVTADIAGSRKSDVDVPDGESVEALLVRLISRYPNLASQKLLIAVNEEYADTDTILKDGDEVAIFTAVSGG